VALDERTGGAGDRRRQQLLTGCDADQVEAITTEATPLLVLAGAGSGKTRVLTRRIAWRVLSASAASSHVLALTFTRKAASELRTRLRALGLPDSVTAGTFHAVALAELKRLSAERHQSPPVILSSKARVLIELTEGGFPAASTPRGRQAGRRPALAGTPRDHGAGSGPGPLISELAQEIEWAKARCIRPEGYERSAALAGRRCSWAPAEVAEAWRRYELEKRRRGVLDFDDLLIRCEAELATDAEFAASARWRFRHLFVDEYQDINEVQLRLLRAWMAGGSDVCVVGDPNQAIYAWNGSDPRAIIEFAEQFPTASVVRLRTNYRSTMQVLSVASAVLGDGEPAPAGGPSPEGAIPTITEYATDLEEAAGVAAALRLAKRPGRRWSQLAVLARTNGQLSLFEQQLRAGSIPCRVGGSGYLRRPWVAEAVRQASRLSSGAELAAFADDLRSGLEFDDDEARDEAGAAPAEQRLEERIDLAELVRLLGEYLGDDPAPTGTSWRAWLDTVVRDEGPAGRDAVDLTTFHRAKGLEWAVVFVTGLEEGLVPVAHARDPDALAEERRLLYVACTRAEEELHCSYALERTFASGRPGLRTPSVWLAAIEAAGKELRRLARPSASAAREALAESRRMLGVEGGQRKVSHERLS
jgi:DNA helicase-2/ATP-dependent DNA helicase PcrA